MKNHTVIAVLMALFVCSTARASLKWEQTVVDLHPAPGDEKAVGTFKYKNTGSAPIRFNSIRTSCGCTTASQNKEVAAPGESGEITATFKIGSNTGVQQKTVRVETDDPNEPVVVLTLKATIPQLVELKPSFIYWEGSEAAKPKVISVTTAKGLNARSLKVSSSNNDFSTKVANAGPNTFKIEVTPRDTSHATNATLTIAPDSGGKVVYATARVVNPAQTN